jgi:septum formation inhibitor-activating ATPase MinD
LNDPVEPEAANRSLLGKLLLVIALFIVAQSAVVTTGYKKLWPFSPVRVYSGFPSDLKSRDMNVVVVTPGVEVDVSRVVGVNSRILRLLTRRLKHAESEEEARSLLAPVLAYLRAENTDGLQIDGVRAYELEWDLAEGKVTGSKLLHEYPAP